MKLTSLLQACAVAGWLTLPAQAAPSAQQIIDKWIDAIGGRTALEKITSREAKGTLAITAMNLHADLVYLGKAPNQRLIEISLGEFGKAREGFDGQIAWSANPGAPITTKTGRDLARARREAVFHQELNFTKFYPKLSVEGPATVGDRPAWILKATTPEGDEESNYFDQDTGMLLRKDTMVDTPEGRVKARILFEDYRRIDGVSMAHTVRMPEPASVAFVMQFSEVRHNQPIPDDRFEQPTE